MVCDVGYWGFRSRLGIGVWVFGLGFRVWRLKSFTYKSQAPNRLWGQNLGLAAEFELSDVGLATCLRA